MKDKFGRTIKYLRLSVTDLCNLRCIYCMGENGVHKKSHNEILSIEELTEIAATCYELGIKKIRLTGGEPLVRKGIVTLCENIKNIAPDIELALTTNGTLLPSMAQSLKKAGVDRLNISLDTLDEKEFRGITRIGRLSDTLNGIKAAQEAGFDNIKINSVIIGGVNDGSVFELIDLAKDNPVQLRFIELMPLGITKDWNSDKFVILNDIESGLQRNAQLTIDGVARVYQIPTYKGSVGFISPMSHSFCSSCDRIRVTANGRLKPCLHSDIEVNLKDLHGEALKNAIADGIMLKPKQHKLLQGEGIDNRFMNEIGG